jgi:hypothetical protein
MLVFFYCGLHSLSLTEWSPRKKNKQYLQMGSWDLGQQYGCLWEGHPIHFKHHALEYMGPTNELDVTLSGKGWLLFELAVHAPSTPERVGISHFGLQRKNKVDDFAPAQTSR